MVESVLGVIFFTAMMGGLLWLLTCPGAKPDDLIFLTWGINGTPKLALAVGGLAYAVSLIPSKFPVVPSERLLFVVAAVAGVYLHGETILGIRLCRCIASGRCRWGRPPTAADRASARSARKLVMPWILLFDVLVHSRVGASSQALIEGDETVKPIE